MVSEQVKNKIYAGFDYMLRHFGKPLTIELVTAPQSYDPDEGKYNQTNLTYSNIMGVLLKKKKTGGSPDYLPDIYYKAMFRESDLEDAMGALYLYSPRLGDFIVDGDDKYTIIEITKNIIRTFICKKE